MKRSFSKVRLRCSDIEMFLLKSNLSQNDLAYRLRISSGFMSQLMKGDRCPSPALRRKIVKAIKGYTWDQLFEIVKI